jgi:hypothetical protein
MKHGTARAQGAPEIEDSVDLLNRRDTTYYYGNSLNIYQASQSVIITSAHDRAGKIILSTRYYFRPGTVIRVIGDARDQAYELFRFIGNEWGRTPGKRYEIKKCGGAWNLDDYAALRAGKTVYK